ncbi:nuclear protein 1 isoform X2 [Tachyglossus aculeatus]|uniref:nuclear protein 1 isoform X2 n=1 Tax=Tachyglossus aculeatus TaxID=9261 RepID=UPI0018F47A58|nr:nuclear protein 1 isoform X2 [Tachyglossus aculeatus]
MMGVEAGGKSGDKFPCQDIGVCSRLGQGPITSELEWGCKRGRRRKRRRKRRRRLTPIRSGRTKKRSQKTEPHRHVNGNLGRQIGPQDSWTGRFSGGKNSEALMATDPLPASPRQPPASVEREEEDYLALDELYNLGGGARKGRSKKEAAVNTNRPSPGGHERKLVTKLQNMEKKKKGAHT